MFAALKKLVGLNSGYDGSLTDEDINFSFIDHYGLLADPTCFYYDPTLSVVAIAGSNGIIKVYGRPSAEITLYSGRIKQPAKYICILPQTSQLVVIYNQDVEIWNLQDRTLQTTFDLPAPSTCYAHIHLSPFIYVGLQSGQICVLNASKGHVTDYHITLVELDLHEEAATMARLGENRDWRITALAVNPEAQHLILVGFIDSRIIEYDVVLKKVKSRYGALMGTPHQLSALAWHSAGEKFLSGHVTGQVFMWKQRKEKPEREIPLSKSETKKPILRLEYTSMGANKMWCALGGTGKDEPNMLSFEMGKDKQRFTITTTETAAPNQDLIGFQFIHTDPHGNAVDPTGILALGRDGRLHAYQIIPPQPVGSATSPAQSPSRQAGQLQVAAAPYVPFRRLELPPPLPMQLSPIQQSLIVNCPAKLLDDLRKVCNIVWDNPNDVRFLSPESAALINHHSDLIFQAWPLKGGSFPTVDTTIPKLLITVFVFRAVIFWVSLIAIPDPPHFRTSPIGTKTAREVTISPVLSWEPQAKPSAAPAATPSPAPVSPPAPGSLPTPSIQVSPVTTTVNPQEAPAEPTPAPAEAAPAAVPPSPNIPSSEDPGPSTSTSTLRKATAEPKFERPGFQLGWRWKVSEPVAVLTLESGLSRLAVGGFRGSVWLFEFADNTIGEVFSSVPNADAEQGSPVAQMRFMSTVLDKYGETVLLLVARENGSLYVINFKNLKAGAGRALTGKDSLVSNSNANATPQLLNMFVVNERGKQHVLPKRVWISDEPENAEKPKSTAEATADASSPDATRRASVSANAPAPPANSEKFLVKVFVNCIITYRLPAFEKAELVETRAPLSWCSPIRVTKADQDECCLVCVDMGSNLYIHNLMSLKRLEKQSNLRQVGVDTNLLFLKIAGASGDGVLWFFSPQMEAFRCSLFPRATDGSLGIAQMHREIKGLPPRRKSQAGGLKGLVGISSHKEINFDEIFKSPPMRVTQSAGSAASPRSGGMIDEQSARDQLLGKREGSTSSTSPAGDRTKAVTGQTNELKNQLEMTKEHLQERGKRIEDLGQRTQEMENESRNFASLAKKLADQKNKKWYQL